MLGNTDAKMTQDFILTFLIKLPFVTKNCTDLCLSVFLSEICKFFLTGKRFVVNFFTRSFSNIYIFTRSCSNIYWLAQAIPLTRSFLRVIFSTTYCLILSSSSHQVCGRT